MEAMISRRYPVHVFHHVPKCGGQSVLEVLRNWFILVEDYRSASGYKQPVNLRNLRSIHCLCGHFELEGHHICERYPDICKSDNYRLITFLRDPLEVKLSLYRYEMEMYGSSLSFDEHLFTRNNYLASIFPVTAENYQETLDKYYFVGIIENAQAGVNALADLLNKPRQPIPWVNRTDVQRESAVVDITPTQMSRFLEENQLDYALYNYARLKYEEAAIR